MGLGNWFIGIMDQELYVESLEVDIRSVAGGSFGLVITEQSHLTN